MQHVRVAMTSAPRALRVHRLQTSAPGQPAPRATALLELKQRAELELRQLQATEQAARAIERVLAELPPLIAARLDELRGHVTELALAVAGEILGAGLSQGLLDPGPAVARCLAEVVQGGADATLTIRLCPDDLQRVLAALEHDPKLRERTRGAHVVPDRALARGTVEVETGAGRLRYEPHEVFQRIAAAVRKELGQGAP